MRGGTSEEGGGHTKASAVHGIHLMVLDVKQRDGPIMILLQCVTFALSNWYIRDATHLHVFCSDISKVKHEKRDDQEEKK